MTISIVVADDHPVVLRGLRSLLESNALFAVVGEASDGLEAVEQVERFQPHVVILDLMMPGLGGLEALKIIRNRAPKTAIIVLSMHANHAFIAEALKHGAAGYVLKGSSEENLLLAVREVAAGRRYLSPPVTEIAIDAYIAQTQTGTSDPHDTLTAREREILQMVAEGHSSPEIGTRLHLSSRTVENHRASLMRKLGLQSHTELVRYALRRGLIALDE